ncbi:ATP-grasp domain-containing protein [Natronoglycomyces albus]|uniref:ATP-grasp domain-containing protein n=1 Tax=Natronoglycomyces albus TaxID=2811108 RepID=A0A895XP44_9ACTN|nr:ATP-grasp domain-containing protein [Natronoglycomyces albus]QSB04845.1 ATP-grasp domain-containing protein [Natronoglycomyces albus]
MPTDIKRLLMVMPYHQLARKAVETGFEVWAIWDPALQSQDYLLQVEEHASLYLADFSDLEGLADLIRDVVTRHDIDAVVHVGAEATMVAAAEAAGSVALNRPQSLRILNDKATMRATLNEHPEHRVVYQQVDTVEAAVAVCSQGLGDIEQATLAPVIVKPALSSGSRGVGLIGDMDDLEQWRHRVEAAEITGPFVVEEFLSGPEYSIETLTVEGRHHLIGVTAKETTGAPTFVETGHIHPAPLSSADTSRLKDAAFALLDLAGYTFGPAHTEAILTERGVRIVESQARLGGDRLPAVIETATGFDIEAAIFRSLAHRPLPQIKAYQYGAVGFFRFPPGELTAEPDREAAVAWPWVRELKFPFTAGEVLPAAVHSGTRHGHVVVGGDTPQEVKERIATVTAHLGVHTRTNPEGAPE